MNFQNGIVINTFKENQKLHLMRNKSGWVCVGKYKHSGLPPTFPFYNSLKIY